MTHKQHQSLSKTKSRKEKRNLKVGGTSKKSNSGKVPTVGSSKPFVFSLSNSGLKAHKTQNAQFGSGNGLRKTHVVEDHFSNKMKTSKGVSVTGIQDINFGDVISTVGDVVRTGTRLASGDPSALLAVPNTIMKVIDTGSSVIRDLNKKDGESKVIVNPSEKIESQNEVVLEKLKKTIPVIHTSSLPTAFANEVTLPPVVTTEKIVNGRRILNIKGSNVLPPLEYAATYIVHRAYAIVITPVTSGFFGPRCKAISEVFQKWKLNSMQIEYIPTQPTNQPGNVILNILESTNIPLAATTLSDLSQREHFAMTSSYSKTTLRVPGRNTWFYTDETNPTGSDIKFFTGWTAEFYTAGNINTLVGEAGYPVISFDIDFCAAAESSYNLLQRFIKNTIGFWISEHRGISLIDTLTMIKKFCTYNLRKDDDKLLCSQSLNAKNVCNELKSIIEDGDFKYFKLIPRPTLEGFLSGFIHHYGDLFLMAFGDSVLDTRTVLTFLRNIITGVLKQQQVGIEFSDSDGDQSDEDGPLMSDEEVLG